MHDKDPHVEFYKNYSRGNAELAVEGYIRRYGPMSQEEILENIAAADERLSVTAQYDSTYRRMSAYADDLRIWFVCVQWMEHGFYTEHSCIYYQRKYQDGEQAETACLDIAKRYDARLYGYPGGRLVSNRFITYPDHPNEDNLTAIKDAINDKLHQWSMLPAVLSDIRIWPLRFTLPIDNTVQVPPVYPWVCVPGSW